MRYHCLTSIIEFWIMSSSELETSKLNGEGGEGAPRSPNPEARGSSDSKSCWEFHCKSDIDRGESELDVTLLVTPSPAALSGACGNTSSSSKIGSKQLLFPS